VGNDTISASFELAVECEPPAGTTFYGLIGQDPVQLTDPDEDGTYDGSLTLSADFGTFPIPVWIIAGDLAYPQQTIKSFDKVVLNDGDNFSASTSFCDGDGGSDNSGGSGNSGSGSGSSSSAGSGSSSGGAKTLPATGGALPIVGLLGVMLVGSGLLVRRIAR
jgi:uncharacterized membrane protein YgcG